MARDNSFQALRLVRLLVRLLLQALAVLSVAGGAISGVVLMAHKSAETGKHDLVAAGVGVFVGSIVWAIFALAAAEAISLGLAIEHNTRPDGTPRKTCPQCAELIRAAARVCPHCRAGVAGVPVAEPLLDGVDTRDMEIADYRAAQAVDALPIDTREMEIADYQAWRGRHARHRE
jgi:hypothetical protein